MIKIGNIEVYTYNDGINSASYDIRHVNEGHELGRINLYQSEMEILIAALKPLVEQNKQVRKCSH